jgi:hypothetical protein
MVGDAWESGRVSPSLPTAAWVRNHWLAIHMACWFVAFSSLTSMALVLRSQYGSLAEFLQWGLFFWPYPALLALQTWGPSPWVIVALQLTGLGLVVAFGVWLRGTFAVFSEQTRWGGALAAVVWCLPLIVFQLVLVLVMVALGFKVGE